MNIYIYIYLYEYNKALGPPRSLKSTGDMSPTDMSPADLRANSESRKLLEAAPQAENS